ncbi:MAG TPA: CDP-alcohol phosphatidyltransferase family protein [Polyangia bacterium]
MSGKSALIPVGVAAAYIAVTAVLYLLFGRAADAPARDPRVEKPHHSALAPSWLIGYITFALRPIERFFMLARVSPNALTFGSLCTAGLAAFECAIGNFAAGGWALLLTGALDLFDGRIARATGRVTASGAFYDSIVDRYAEGLVFAGLAVYYRQSPILYVVLACMIGSYMVSYTRARGESLGVSSAGGTMQRPERIVALGFGLALSPAVAAFLEPASPRPVYYLAVVALAFVALSASGTALWRFGRVFALLRAQDAPAAKPAEAPPAAAPGATTPPLPSTRET